MGEKEFCSHVHTLLPQAMLWCCLSGAGEGETWARMSSVHTFILCCLKEAWRVQNFFVITAWLQVCSVFLHQGAAWHMLMLPINGMLGEALPLTGLVVRLLYSRPLYSRCGATWAHTIRETGVSDSLCPAPGNLLAAPAAGRHWHRPGGPVPPLVFGRAPLPGAQGATTAVLAHPIQPAFHAPCINPTSLSAFPAPCSPLARPLLQSAARRYRH